MSTKVEGVDYTAEGITLLRDELIVIRDESMNQWPEAIPVTVVLSHTIAVLGWVVEEILASNREGKPASG